MRVKTSSHALLRETSTGHFTRRSKDEPLVVSPAVRLRVSGSIVLLAERLIACLFRGTSQSSSASRLNVVGIFRGARGARRWTARGSRRDGRNAGPCHTCCQRIPRQIDFRPRTRSAAFRLSSPFPPSSSLENDPLLSSPFLYLPFLFILPLPESRPTARRCCTYDDSFIISRGEAS